MDKNVSDKLVISIRTALFWVIAQQVAVISYCPFGTTYRSHLQGSISVKILFGLLTIENGTNRLYRNVARNCHYSLRNNPEECNSHLVRGRSLKSRPVLPSFTAKVFQHYVHSYKTISQNFASILDQE
jgi:hypothetical protein